MDHLKTVNEMAESDWQNQYEYFLDSLSPTKKKTKNNNNNLIIFFRFSLSITFKESLYI